MCLDTGCLALLLIGSTKICVCIEGLKRLIYRFSVAWELVRADRAFKSARFAEALPGVEISLTAPSTPYTNPVERLHADVRSIVRYEKFVRRCIVRGSDLQVQDALDRVAAIVNSRPLGRFQDEGCEAILTPSRLAFGTTMIGGDLPRLRQYFYKQVFASLRRVYSSKAGAQYCVGQRALYLVEGGSKSDARFELCRILDVRPPYFLIILIDSRKEKIVGKGSLCPLVLPLLTPDVAGPRLDVSRVGARISALYQHKGVEQEFTGIVIAELTDGFVEVKWDDERWKRTEILDWRACRVLLPGVE